MANQKVLEILLRTAIDRKLSEEEVNKGLKQMQEKVNNKPLKFKTKYDEKSLQASKTQYFKDIENIEKQVKDRFKNLGVIKTTVNKDEKGRIRKVTAAIRKENGQLEQKIFKLKVIKNLEGRRTKAFVGTAYKDVDDDKRIHNVVKAREMALKQDQEITNKRIELASREAKAIWKKIDDERKAISDLQRDHIRALAEDEKRTQRKIELAHAEAKAINKRMDDARAKEEKLADFQSKMRNKSDQLTATAGSVMTRQQRQDLQQWNAQVQSLTTSTPRLTNRMNELRNEFVSINNQIRNTANSALRFGETIRDAFKKFALWLGIGNVLMGIIRTIKSAFAYIKEMDDSLTELAKVTTFTTKELNDMKDSAIELGRELGRSSVDIMNAFAEFGRISKIKEDIIALTESAVLAGNVSTMTAQTAAKAINTAMISFRIEAKDSIDIVDQWNELQNNFRVSAEDMARAIGVVGVAAKQAGIEIEQLNGYVATMTGATGLTGAEVATSLKSIISRLYRLGTGGKPSDAGDAEKLLNKIGITIRNVSGDFRGFNDILIDLNAKWGTLSDIQKQNIAQTIAGTYHYSKFLGLMENFGTAQEATAMAMNSTGSAMIENEKYLDSIEGKLNKLTVASENLYDGFIDSGFIKTFIDLATVLIDTFSNIEYAIMALSVVVSIFWGNLIKTSVAAAFTAAIASIRGSIAAFVLTTRVAATSNSLLAVSVSSLRTAFNLLWITISTNPIASIVIGISSLILVLKALEETQAELIEDIKELNKEYDRTMEKIDFLSSKYEENFINAKSDEEAKQNLIDAEIELRDALKSSTLELDNQNKSLEENMAIINDATIQTLSIQKAKLQGKLDKAKSNLDSPASIFTQLGEEASILNWLKNKATMSQLRELDLEPEITEILNTNKTSATSAFSKSFTLREMNNEFDRILRNQAMYLKKEGITKELIAEIALAHERINNEIKETNKLKEAELNIEKDLINRRTKNEVLYKNLTKEQKVVFDIVKDSIRLESTLPTHLESYKKSLLEVLNIIKDTDFATYTDTLVDRLTKMSEIEIEGIVKELYALQKGIENTINPAQELGAKLALVEDELGLLAKAYDEMNENGELSLDVIEELAKQYPDLLDALEFEGDKIKLNTELIQDSFDTKKSIWVAEAEARKSRLIELKNETLLAMELHNMEIKSIDGIGKAYAELFGGAKLRKAAEESLIEQGKLTRAEVNAPSVGVFGEDLSFNTRRRDYLIEQEKTRLVQFEPQFKLLKDYQENVMNSTQRIKEQEQAIEVLKRIKIENLVGSDSSSDKGKDKDSYNAPKNIKADIDYLQQYIDELARINALIANAKAKIEKSTDPVEIRNTEGLLLSLIGKRTNAINNLAWMQSKQQESLKKGLIDEGIVFNKHGQIVQDVYEKILKSKASVINSMKGESQQEYRDQLEEDFKVFQQQIADYKNLKGEVDSFWADVFSSEKEGKDLYVKLALQSSNELINSLTEEADRLRNKLDSIVNEDDKILAQNEFMTNLSNTIGDLSSEYANLKEVTDETVLASDEYNELLSSLETNMRAYVTELRNVYQQQLNLRIKNVKDTETMIQNMIKDGLEMRKKALDEELDIYTKFMDDKLEQRNREFEEQDYKDDLKDQMETRQEIQDKINALMFDNSFASYQKRKELEEQLAEEDEKLQEIRTDRNRKLQLQEIKDNKEYGEDKLKDKKEALEEEWTEEKIKVEAHNALVRESFDLLKQEFPEVFGEISGSFSSFIDDIVSYEIRFGNSIGRMVKHVEDELTPSIEQAIKDASRLSMLENRVKTGDYIGQEVKLDPRIVKQNEIERAKQEIGKLQTEWNVINEFKKHGMPHDSNRLKQIEDEAKALRNKYNMDFEDLQGYSANIVGFANGGVNTKTGLAMLHGTPKKPEYIFNSEQFNSLIKGETSILGGKKDYMQGNVNNNLVINVYSDSSADTVSKVRQAGKGILTEIKRAMNRNGTYR